MHFCYILNMITVPETTKKIVERSRYLTEALSKNLINLSSLARYIKPEIEDILIKDVSEASILMALKRLSTKLKPPSYKNIFTTPPDILVRSNLFEISIANSETLANRHQELVKICGKDKGYFFTMTQGLFETGIIASSDLQKEIQEILTEEKIIGEFTNLSAISIRLPKENISTPGVYYFLLKSLAWEEINIMEIVSNYLEVTLIFEEKEVHRAFSILKSIFNNK